MRPGVALVTGAGHRVGREIALDLAGAGWAVGVHHHRSDRAAREVVREIAARGGRAAPFSADLAVEDEAAGLTARVAAALGPVSLLVNNASTFERDQVHTATRATWDHHLEVNLRAPFVLVQHLAAQLPAEADGLVVNLLDQRVWNPSDDFVTYTLSKSGLWTLTRTLALALAPRIRVNAIGPGAALPNARQSAAQFAAFAEATPLRRATSPEEIAAAVRYLVASPSVTGQMIALDGGQHLWWAPPHVGPPPE